MNQSVNSIEMNFFYILEILKWISSQTEAKISNEYIHLIFRVTTSYNRAYNALFLSLNIQFKYLGLYLYPNENICLLLPSFYVILEFD